MKAFGNGLCNDQCFRPGVTSHNHLHPTTFGAVSGGSHVPLRIRALNSSKKNIFWGPVLSSKASKAQLRKRSWKSCIRFHRLCGWLCQLRPTLLMPLGLFGNQRKHQVRNRRARLLLVVEGNGRIWKQAKSHHREKVSCQKPSIRGFSISHIFTIKQRKSSIFLLSQKRVLWCTAQSPEKN